MDAILAEISQFNATEKEKRTGLKRKSSTTKQSDTTVIKLDSKVNNVCHSSSGLPDKSVLADKWTFATDYNDHFETPQIAYLDIYNILYDVAMKLDKCIEDLVIYDPYYCDGSMKSLLTGMGFKNVINENRDFYSDISRGLVPGQSICYKYLYLFCLLLLWYIMLVNLYFLNRIRCDGHEPSLFRGSQSQIARLPEQLYSLYECYSSFSY